MSTLKAPTKETERERGGEEKEERKKKVRKSILYS